MQGGILSATESSKAATTETNFVRISTNKPQFTMADFIFGAVFCVLFKSFVFMKVTAFSKNVETVNYRVS